MRLHLFSSNNKYDMKNQKITVETKVEAPIQKVWDYWTQPKYITQWNFADDSWFCPTAENDLRVGGKLSSRMEAKDGSFGFDFWGIYEVIEPLHTLVYTLEDGRKVEVLFKEKGDFVVITELFDPENENLIEMQKGGWQAILNNFKKLIENS
jgi:uncharacterized protein YndB with AHSA1/START domain